VRFLLQLLFNIGEEFKQDLVEFFQMLDLQLASAMTFLMRFSCSCQISTCSVTQN
jgi:hypothetical protein